MNQNKRNKIRSTLTFIGAIFCGIAIFIVFLFSMGANLEKPNLTPAKPSQSEIKRQNLVLQLEKIRNASSTHSNLDSLNQAIQDWERELGGLWIPWPEGAPDGYENPKLDLKAESQEPQYILTQLNNFASEVLTIGDNKPIWRTTISLSARAQYQSNLVAKKYQLPHTSKIDENLLARGNWNKENLQQIEIARQWLEVKAANTTADKQKDYLPLIQMLDNILNATLETGVKDTRPALSSISLNDTTPLQNALWAIVEVGSVNELQIRRTAAQIVAQLLTIPDLTLELTTALTSKNTVK